VVGRGNLGAWAGERFVWFWVWGDIELEAEMSRFTVPVLKLVMMKMWLRSCAADKGNTRDSKSSRKLWRDSAPENLNN